MDGAPALPAPALAAAPAAPLRLVRPLDAGWELLRLPPGGPATPAALRAATPSGWCPACVPGTVAQALGAAADGLELDAWDVWYRCPFEAAPRAGARALLRLEGLATLAEVWLNGERLLESEDMFLAHEADVTGLLRGENELLIRFRALQPVLRARRPRGRWPTRLVSEKNLRFVRTTLLGYLPGFCPPTRPVGPWRPVTLVTQPDGAAPPEVRLRPRLEGAAGVLDLTIVLADPGPLVAGEVTIGGRVARSTLRADVDAQGRLVVRGEARVEGLEPWWPHTHGRPALHAASARLRLAGRTVEVDLGTTGFRDLRLVRDGGGFALRLNGAELFCRGACWTPLDVRSLQATEDEYRRALTLVRDAGMNMVRVVGVGVYEQPAFHRVCDELGLLVWQDFMFANLDYPTDDPAFLAVCQAEARQLLGRIGAGPSLAVLCGNSEVAQQAAMMGAPAEQWSSALFDQALPALCAELAPGVPYLSSSPGGDGALPFHLGGGPSHYYGVGAYLRPIDEARAAPVRFASECLAFSNVPEDEGLRAWLGEEGLPAHHPRWKERVPRDGGAGWDFADVTDHYLEALFGVEARAVRWSDHERYLALCRVTSGEVMARVQGLWRRRGSTCRGALVWLLRDLWPGAGWGLVDAGGLPKAPWWYLRRAWAPLAVWLVDDGVNGLTLHADNETPAPVEGRLELELYRPDGQVAERADVPLRLEAREQRAISVEALLGRFVDSSRAYRFGPAVHSLTAARLVGADGQALARAFHHADGPVAQGDPGLSATARRLPDGAYEVTVRAERFAQAVAVDAPGWTADDSYFHLAPRVAHTLRLRPRGAPPHAGAPLRARLRPLNGAPVRVELEGAR